MPRKMIPKISCLLLTPSQICQFLRKERRILRVLGGTLVLGMWCCQPLPPLV